MTWGRLGASVIAALVALLVAFGEIQAAPVIVNGDFESLPHALNSGKEFYTSDTPIGWGSGSGGGPLGQLSAVNSVTGPGPFQNTATSFANGTIGVYGPFPSSPTGGNFLQADADPGFRPNAFTTTVTGLTPGQQYAISFWQAAGQQNGFRGATFEQWLVSLGAETHASHLINLPDQGIAPWELQTLIFTATNSSDTLSFLATGSSVLTTGNSLPPIIFLDGVSVSAVPEPSSVALMCLMLLGLAIAYRRQRAARAAGISI